MPLVGVGKFVFVTWLTVLCSVANASCDFATHAYRDELADPSEIKHIGVEIKKSRKWFKNSISILTSHKFNIDDKFKDKLGANIIVRYRFGRCVYAAKVRQNGDWKDHIKMLPGGNVISSLDVRLREGNILNAVRFKLLIPETRKGVNEVLGTLLLQELGYLAPETFLVSADINGVSQTMLFQENAEKELLERRNRREGPIFEGDESLLWSGQGWRDQMPLQDISLARQTNTKWAEKGATSLQISLEAFEKLQSAYTVYADDVEKKGRFRGLGLVPNTEASQPDFENYAIVLLAMHGSHALAPHNRKFYFNSFTQAFEPIYYDGDLDPLGKPKFQKKPNFADMLDFFLKYASPEVILQSVEQVESLARDSRFRQAYLDRAGSDQVAAETLFDDALPKISKRLRAYHDEMLEQANVEVSKSPADPQALQRQLIERTKEHGADVQYVLILQRTKKGAYLARHAFEDSDASTFELSPEALIEVLSKNTHAGSRMSLLADQTKEVEAKSRSEMFLTGEIVLSEGARVDINHADRSMTVSQLTPTDWVLVRGVSLDDWDIAFEGAPQDATITGGQRFNEFGLTGCLNFYDVVFDNVRISGQQGQCEDSVNIVSSRGTLGELVVENGFADAIDIDFSEVTIDSLRVASTGNDCFDVSTGNFEISQAVLSDCGDKGISVGENSLLKAESVDIRNAAIGISSKDFSRVTIDEFTGTHVPICAEAFQKKQEFGGGYLQIDAYRCTGEVNQDAHSNIVLDELTQ